MKTLAEHAIEVLGLDRRQLMWRLGLAKWDAARLRSEVDVVGCKERLLSESEAGIPNEAEDRSFRWLSAMCKEAKLEIGDPRELESRVKSKKLRQVIGEYTSGGLLICGPTGVGKSMAMLAVARSVAARTLENGLRAFLEDRVDSDRPSAPEVSWHRALDLANARAETRLGDGEPDAVRDAKQTGLLLLDDIGWESSRAGSADVVTEVIATRYDRGLITIATTGQRLGDFTTRYGAAVVRRIQEAGGKPGKVVDAWSG